MLGGFTNFGCPLHLLYELGRHREIKDLVLISEDLGYGGLPYPQGPTVLLLNGQIKKCITSFLGNHPVANDLILNHKVEIELIPQGTLAEKIRAGGAGIGGFYTATGIGTVVEQKKETRIINGKKYLLEFPLRADVALVKAYKSDLYGNAVFKYSSENFNTIMATAADFVILEVEKLVDVGEIEPDQVKLPGLFVDCIVQKEGAIF